jgi:predicted phosphodiesterase
MRLAVISDIHGNLEAFRSVLADLDRQNVDDIICLGDNVGYGPEPQKVLDLLARRGIESVTGNHELGVLAWPDLEDFNPNAAQTITRTRDLTENRGMQAIRQMPLFIVRHGCRLVHGMPPESCRSYLYLCGNNELPAVFHRYKERICFVGHTHELRLVMFDGSRAARRELDEETVRLHGVMRYIVNAGSVGQPRDGDNRAKYVIWDSNEDTLQARFVAYDIAATVKRMKEVGLPKRYADRLW